MAKYLDEVGLRRVWSYMKSYVDYKLGTADKLTTARAIDGVAFNGTARQRRRVDMGDTEF